MNVWFEVNQILLLIFFSVKKLICLKNSKKDSQMCNMQKYNSLLTLE